MTRPDPVIHIGYHKTATTYLQDSVFSDAAIFDQPWGRFAGDAVEHFVLAHPERFDAAAVRADFMSRLADPEGRIPLISNEELSGNPMNGRYNLDRVAQRIHACFPAARILIGIREQGSVIFSNYYQYVRQGGTAALHDLLTSPRQGPGYRPVMRLDHFEYDLAITHYRRLFGPDRVLVLPIELLRRTPAAYFDRLGEFLGTDRDFPRPCQVVNASRADLSMRIERMLNKVIPVPHVRAEHYRDNPLLFRVKNRALRQLDRLLAGGARARRPRMRAEIDAFVGDHFVMSNRATAELTGLDLAALGYRV